MKNLSILRWIRLSMIFFFPIPLRRRKAAAFTVVELLVTIGIIAFLAILLFPQTRRLAGASKQVGCANNMRILGAGIHAYAGENSGNFPVTKPPIWCSKDGVGPYVGYPNAVYTKLLGTGPVFCCPAAKQNFLPDSNDVPQSGSYYPNQYLMPNTADAPVRVVNVAKPSRTILLLESYSGGSGTAPVTFGNIATASNPNGGGGRFRHGAAAGKIVRAIDAKKGDAMNILFVDGHVELRPLLRNPQLTDRLGYPDGVFGNDIFYSLDGMQ